MKKVLREKLLETRKEFEQIEGKEKYKNFLLEVDFSFDGNNTMIIMRKLATTENDECIPFGLVETIMLEDNAVDTFLELLAYAEDRYASQFIYAIHPFIYCLYGNEMNTDKFKRILKMVKGNEEVLNGKMGFAVIENIF